MTSLYLATFIYLFFIATWQLTRQKIPLRNQQLARKKHLLSHQKEFHFLPSNIHSKICKEAEIWKEVAKSGQRSRNTLRKVDKKDERRAVTHSFFHTPARAYYVCRCRISILPHFLLPPFVHAPWKNSTSSLVTRLANPQASNTSNPGSVALFRMSDAHRVRSTRSMCRKRKRRKDFGRGSWRSCRGREERIVNHRFWLSHLLDDYLKGQYHYLA